MGWQQPVRVGGQQDVNNLQRRFQGYSFHKKKQHMVYERVKGTRSVMLRASSTLNLKAHVVLESVSIIIYRASRPQWYCVDNKHSQ